MDVGSGTPGALARIDELGTTISAYRVQFLLAQDRVALATLISESVRIVSGPLEVRATPRVGSVTVDRRRGVLIGRAIADLLKNCLEHGAQGTEIACTPLWLLPRARSRADRRRRRAGLPPEVGPLPQPALVARIRTGPRRRRRTAAYRHVPGGDGAAEGPAARRPVTARRPPRARHRALIGTVVPPTK